MEFSLRLEVLFCGEEGLRYRSWDKRTSTRYILPWIICRNSI